MKFWKFLLIYLFVFSVAWGYLMYVMRCHGEWAGNLCQ